jgi:hypothetical protein
MTVEVDADNPADAREAALNVNFDINKVHEFAFHEYRVDVQQLADSVPTDRSNSNA